jgi:hypothetical protein
MTGKFTTTSVRSSITSPVATAASTSERERRVRGVAPTFQVTITTDQRGL